MLRAFESEKGSFFFFLLLTVLTAFLFSFSSEKLWSSGVPMAALGLFGFWRFSVLGKQEGKVKSVGSLPARLLIALKTVENMAASSGLQRLNHLDILIWFLGGIFFCIWVGMNVFLPSYPERLQEIQISLDRFWFSLDQESGVQTSINISAFFREISFLFCMGVAGFLAHSYAYNLAHIKKAAFIFLPILFLGALFLLFWQGAVEHIYYLDFSHFRGAGTGRTDLLVSLSPEFKGGVSPLWKRSVEQGSIGVLFVYILFLPAIFSLFRFLMQMRERRLVAVCGLVCLFLLFLIDSFWLNSIYTQSLFFCGGLMVCLCWGQTGYRYPPRLDLNEKP